MKMLEREEVPKRACPVELTNEREELAVMWVLGHEFGHLAAKCSVERERKHELAADARAGSLMLDFAQRDCGDMEATRARTRQAVAAMEATLRALDWAAVRQRRTDKWHPCYADRVASLRERCCISDDCRAYSDLVQSELTELFPSGGTGAQQVTPAPRLPI